MRRAINLVRGRYPRACFISAPHAGGHTQGTHTQTPPTILDLPLVDVWPHAADIDCAKVEKGKLDVKTSATRRGRRERRQHTPLAFSPRHFDER